MYERKARNFEMGGFVAGLGPATVTKLVGNLPDYRIKLPLAMDARTDENSYDIEIFLSINLIYG